MRASRISLVFLCTAMLPNRRTKRSGFAYNDKEGNYWVYINVVTGAVEEIIYSAAIGGNG